MALGEAGGPPWNRSLLGRLDELGVEADVRAGDPLDDPARRSLCVSVTRGTTG